MVNIIKHIPGFRTGSKRKKIIAMIYYLFGLLMFTEGFGFGLFFLAAPFAVFSFVDIAQYKKKAIPIKKAFIPFIVSISLMLTGLIASSETAGPSSPAPSDTKQVETSEDANGATEDEKALALAQDNEEEQKQLKEQRLKEEEEAQKAEEEQRQKELEEQQLKEEEEKRQQEEAAKANKDLLGQLKVHYINVGQGDCILIHTGHNAMLIDAGNSGDGSSIVSYIRNQGITRLDYLILTHPHADHIGGASAVINAIDIDKILMPKVAHTSKTFENLLVAIDNKGLKITSPAPGDDYSLGDASFKILASNNGSDLNDKSIVNKLVFGNTSFLFTGDAQSTIESQILSKGFDIKSDVLKVGHHGSDTSTGESFLKAISPKHAVISVGKNSYGHPTQATLDRLAAHKVDIYRTDEVGTIVATSDGNAITFDKKASPVKQNAPPKETTKKDESKPAAPKEESKPKAPAKEEPKKETKPAPKPDTDNVAEVYIADTGTKYHKDGCQYLKKSKNPISLKKAKADGYEPCKRCNPPK